MQYSMSHTETMDRAAIPPLIDQITSSDLSPGLYLEVGPARSPYFTDSRRSFSEHARYVGIDGGRSEYNDDFNRGWGEYSAQQDVFEMATQRMNQRPDSRYAAMLWGDAQQLPFPTHSRLPIQEVFMRDVLLDTGMHERSMHQIMSEQARVLTQGGRLIIRETTFRGYTDDTYGDAPRFASLIRSLHRVGFTERCAVIDTMSCYDDLLQIFPGGDDDKTMPVGYYLICQKGEVPPTPTWRQRARSVLRRITPH